MDDVGARRLTVRPKRAEDDFSSRRIYKPGFQAQYQRELGSSSRPSYVRDCVYNHAHDCSRI